MCCNWLLRSRAHTRAPTLVSLLWLRYCWSVVTLLSHLIRCFAHKIFPNTFSTPPSHSQRRPRSVCVLLCRFNIRPFSVAPENEKEPAKKRRNIILRDTIKCVFLSLPFDLRVRRCHFNIQIASEKFLFCFRFFFFSSIFRFGHTASVSWRRRRRWRRRQWRRRCAEMYIFGSLGSFSMAITMNIIIIHSFNFIVVCFLFFFLIFLRASTRLVLSLDSVSSVCVCMRARYVYKIRLSIELMDVMTSCGGHATVCQHCHTHTHRVQADR